MLKKARLGAILSRSTASSAFLAIAAAGSTPGFAQEAAQATSQPPADLDGDIVVTAQRRSERASDVPLSLTALSGDSLASAGVQSTRDLNSVVPGLNFSTQGSWAQPSIRGVSSEGSYPGSDVNVAVYLDGIYQPSQQGNIFDLPDVERVEVLRGPQGTLFGRNATGGAIQVFTRDPVYDLTGKVGVSYGGYSKNGGAEKIARGFASIPIVDQQIALSLSGYYRDDSGYLYDDVRHQRAGSVKSGLVRGKLLLEPADGIRLVASAFYRESHDDNAQAMQVLRGNTLARLLAPALNFATAPYHISPNLAPRTEQRAWGGSLRAEFDLGGGTLTSLSGYQQSDQVSVDADVDGTPLAAIGLLIQQPSKTFSQELTYSSQISSLLSIVSGLYYYHDHGGPFSNTADIFGAIQPFYATVNTKAWAAFGDATLNLAANLSVIGGLRYSNERKTVFAGLNPAPPETATKSWTSWTPRFSVRYQFAPRANVYATYSKGFKSGIYDPTTTIGGVNNPANPEYLSSYEVGLKTSGRPFTVNASAFYYDYSNLQRQIFDGIATQVQNAADARVIGVELETVMRPSSDFSVRANFAWLPEAKYTRYPDAAVNIPTGAGGNILARIDATGSRLIRAPEYTVSVNADYQHDYDWGQLGASSTLFFSDTFSYETLGRVSQPSYATLNAQIFFQLKNPGLRFTIFGRNLTDTVYYQSALPSQVADLVGFAPPRQIGASVDYSF